MRQNPLQKLMLGYRDLNINILSGQNPIKEAKRLIEYQQNPEFIAYIEAIGKLSTNGNVFSKTATYAEFYNYIENKLRNMSILLNEVSMKSKKLRKILENDLHKLVSAMEILNLTTKDLETLAMKS